METLFLSGLFLILGIFGGLIMSIIGLFFGNIILFDSIGFGILAGTLSKEFLHIHPAIALLIGIAVFIGFFIIQHTEKGFWIVTICMSVAWGLVITVFFDTDDRIWQAVIMLIATVVMTLLHISARDRNMGK